MIYIRFTI